MRIREANLQSHIQNELGFVMNGICHKWQFNFKTPQIYILANHESQISVPPHIYYTCYING